MFIETLIKNINDASDCRKEVSTKFAEHVEKREQVYPLEDMYEMPKLALEAKIGKDICGVEYCPEDWEGFPMGRDFSGNKSKKCGRFDPKGPRCTKEDCPVYLANQAYFDAVDAHKEAITAHHNAIRRIFGFKAK